MKRNPKCNLCMLHEYCHTKCLWGSGNPKAKLMLVGEAPGLSEDLSGLPFMGQAGKLLDHILLSLGLDRKDLYITNVLKCRPLDNKLPKKRQLVACWSWCSDYFNEEVRNVNPKAVLLMGSTALMLVTDRTPITKYEGLQVTKKGFAAFHPAYVLRSPSKEVRLAQAIARAAVAAGLKLKVQPQDIFKYEIRS